MDSKILALEELEEHLTKNHQNHFFCKINLTKINQQLLEHLTLMMLGCLGLERGRQKLGEEERRGTAHEGRKKEEEKKEMKKMIFALPLSSLLYFPFN